MRRVVVIPDEGMSEEDKQLFLERFKNGEACEWCGGLHNKQCPRIKHVVYHPSDRTKINDIEFWQDGDWDRSGVMWPEDVV